MRIAGLPLLAKLAFHYETRVIAVPAMVLLKQTLRVLKRGRSSNILDEFLFFDKISLSPKFKQFLCFKL